MGRRKTLLVSGDLKTGAGCCQADASKQAAGNDRTKSYPLSSLLPTTPVARSSCSLQPTTHKASLTCTSAPIHRRPRQRSLAHSLTHTRPDGRLAVLLQLSSLHLIWRQTHTYTHEASSLVAAAAVA